MNTLLAKKLILLVAVVILALSAVAPALADQPPGHKGYEGTSGNQGGPHGNGNPHHP